jgi:hypothetical protein
MPLYRYYTTDILTEDVLGDLPLYQVQPDRVLSGIGTLTGKLKLGTGIFLDQDLKVASQPGRVALYMERDGVIIWGGIIWGRKYNSNEKAYDIIAQSWESIFDHVPMLDDIILETYDQQVVFKTIITLMQLQPYNNFNLDLSQIPTDGNVIRSTLFAGYEYHMVSEAINQLIQADNGFDYTIDIVPSAFQDQPDKVIRTGYPRLGTDSEVSFWDYPGGIQSYTWNESASSGGTMFAGLGEGAGVDQKRAVTPAQDLLDQGYPAWWVVRSNPFLTTDAEISTFTAAQRDRYKMPVGSPEFTLKSDRIPEFTEWQALGNNFSVYIQDERFPTGQLITSRMIGWTLQVESQDQAEVLSFNIEAVDDIA